MSSAAPAPDAVAAYDDAVAREFAGLDRQGLERLLGNQRWRLDNLYTIADKEGRVVRFRLNSAQRRLVGRLHNRNLILKARQLGFTTLACMLELDLILFNAQWRCGLIAHTKNDAKRFYRDKILWAYDRLPARLFEIVPEIRPKKREGGELLLANDSGIEVSTSHRGGTLHFLHVSEYGKLCAKWPEKAGEVRSGAIPAVPPSGFCVIESTAEGAEGDFHAKCEQALTLQRLGRPLNRLEWSIVFFPWYEAPEYVTDFRHVPIPDRLHTYFRTLSGDVGVRFTPAQKAWYALMERELGELMKREFPSTPAEAFEAAIEGAYYAAQMADAEQFGRIGAFPVDPSVPVNTAWDVGIDDMTAIWFYQRVGGEYHFVDYLEHSGEGFDHYFRALSQRGYRYGEHTGPHDLRNRQMINGESLVAQIARDYGFQFRIAPSASVQDGIEGARRLFPRCRFDEEKCAEGLARLRQYRKDWNEKTGTWSSKPRHDANSHGADAFRYFALVEDPHHGTAQPRQGVPVQGRGFAGSV